MACAKVLCVTTIVGAALAPAHAQPEDLPERPNIIIILGDDLGYLSGALSGPDDEHPPGRITDVPQGLKEVPGHHPHRGQEHPVDYGEVDDEKAGELAEAEVEETAQHEDRDRHSQGQTLDLSPRVRCELRIVHPEHLERQGPEQGHDTVDDRRHQSRPCSQWLPPGEGPAQEIGQGQRRYREQHVACSQQSQVTSEASEHPS